MDWKLDSSRPIWPQLEEQLKRAIVAGKFKPGDAFPSVRDLAQDAKVNPNTMQRALSELEKEGLVVTIRTAGRRVTEDVSKIRDIVDKVAEESINRFLSEMRALGFSDDEIVELLKRGSVRQDTGTGSETSEDGGQI